MGDAAVSIDENAIQNRLKNAFDSRDLEEFSRCFLSGYRPFCEMYDDEMCFYLKALSTHGCSEFVKVCTARHEHYHREFANHPINYAVMSMDPRAVQPLLPSDWVNGKLNGVTPLNYLAKHVNNHNVDDAINCFKLLLKYSAVAHIPDDHNITPLGHILRNLELEDSNKRKIIEEIIQYDDIENDELRSELLSKFPDLQFPDSLRNTTYVSVTCGDLERFKRYFIQNQPSEKEKLEHLFKAIETKQNDFFDFLLENGVDYTAVDSRGLTALDHSIHRINSYTLKKLIEKGVEQISKSSVLFIFGSTFQSNAENCTSSDECFACLDMLLKSERFDINQNSLYGETLLHFSNNFNEKTTLELLKRKAFVGVKNNSNEIAISKVNPKVLETFFNDLISSNDNEHSPKISMNYSDLMPPPKCPAVCVKQTEIVEAIADSEQSKYLIAHPLIATFLLFKWHQLSPLFYVNFLLYVFFAVSTVTYMILKLSARETGSITFCSMTWFGIVYLIIREALQLVMSVRKYLRSLTNYMELLTITTATLFCSSAAFDRQTEKVIAVVTIALITIELFQLLGSLPVLSMSTRMHMFEVVCASFLKNFLLYSVFVVAFSLCFYIMIGSEADANGDFNEFTNPWKAFLKTTVMMTGELDAGSLKFETSFSYVLFFLFVFIVTIVLYNLLNGTAIRDILEVEGQAKLNEAVHRAKLICRYDRILNDNLKYTRYFPKFNCALRIGLGLVIPFYINEISIRPKDFNRATPVAKAKWCLDPTPDFKIALMDASDDVLLTYKKAPVRLKFDNDVVEKALHILKERRNNSKSQDPANQIQRRLENIENVLAIITEALNRTNNK